MRVFLDVSKLWDEELTVTKAAEDLKMNSRTLTTIKKGTERGNWETLVKLARYFSDRHGRKIALEELLRIEED